MHLSSGASRFQNKTAVITGAASGIGRATALRLAAEGANIVGVDLAEDGLSDLVAAVQTLGQRCEKIVGSVSDLGVIDRAIARAVDVLGGLDCLVNNAGVGGPMRPFDSIKPEEFDMMVAINLKPVWYAMTRACEPMRIREKGAIVNVASMAGLRPNRNHALYGMTKAAVISLTEHAAMDYAVDNIRVNCLCPGPVDTPIFEQMRDNLGSDAYESARRRITQRTLMNRFGNADEQAAAIAYLLSDEASFTTGITMPVDGGWSISDGRVR